MQTGLPGSPLNNVATITQAGNRLSASLAQSGANNQGAITQQ